MVGLDNPVLAERFRGGEREVVHRGAWVVTDAEGAVIAGAGDPDQHIFARSSSKSLQALPLAEMVVAERVGYRADELAITLASHNGEPAHIDAVRNVLGRVDLDESLLQCGASTRLNHPDPEPPTRIKHNCSGKHAGFLAATAVLGADPATYLDPEAPVQQLVRAVVEERCRVTGADLHVGVDGCSAPTFRLPLRSLATGIASVVSDDAAAPRLLVAGARERPDLVAGVEPARFDTALLTASGGRLFAKGGAEGVQVIGVVGAGVAFAGKVDDGNARAIQPVAVEVLRRLGHLGEEIAAAMVPWTDPVVRNADGLAVGEHRMVLDL